MARVTTISCNEQNNDDEHYVCRTEVQSPPTPLEFPQPIVMLSRVVKKKAATSMDESQ